MSDILIALSKEKALDLADLIRLYLQYLQYLKPVSDAAKYKRFVEIKQDLANQLYIWIAQTVKQSMIARAPTPAGTPASFAAFAFQV